MTGTSSISSFNYARVKPWRNDVKFSLTQLQLDIVYNIDYSRYVLITKIPLFLKYAFIFNDFRFQKFKNKSIFIVDKLVFVSGVRISEVWFGQFLCQFQNKVKEMIIEYIRKHWDRYLVTKKVPLYHTACWYKNMVRL